jgi:hypothetical protein
MTHNDTEVEESATMREGNRTIVNMVHYQSAQGLAARTQTLFDDQLKDMPPANSTKFVANLEACLEHLKQTIDDMEPFVDVELIVHSEVHPQPAKRLQPAGDPRIPAATAHDNPRDSRNHCRD